MDFECDGDECYVRVDAGECVVETVLLAVTRLALPAVVVTSGAGTLTVAHLGFRRTGRDELHRSCFEGVLDLNSLTGNVVRRDGTPVPRLYASLNDASHRTLSGQLLEGRSLSTSDVFLSVVDLPLTRLPAPTGTRIAVRG